jgi:hypothetical protein
MGAGLGWVDENAMEHRFTMFVQTAVGKMMLDHAPHHCTVHLPAALPFELPHVKAKALSPLLLFSILFVSSSTSSTSSSTTCSAAATRK